MIHLSEFIDGMRYNTDNAELIAVHEEPNHTENLLKTPNGRWYLVYEFHAPGAAINPMEEDQVFSWMKDHQLMSGIDMHFAKRVPDA